MMNGRCINKSPRSTLLIAVVLGGGWFGFLPQAFAAANARPCASNPDSRALDFWLGEWTIGAAGGAPTATSTVALELDQCLVVERWDGGRGHTGENLFAYSADDRSWHGLFADNEGRVHVFLEGKACRAWPSSRPQPRAAGRNGPESSHHPPRQRDPSRAGMAEVLR